jgi:NitT/TauT family transport system substrate-binding protein
VVLKDSPVKTIKDLKGKTLGVASYASQLNLIMQGLTKDAGLDPKKDLSIVPIGVGPQAIAALRSGQVDAWGTFDAQIAGAEQRGLKLRLLHSPYLDKLSLAAVYIVREDYLEKHQEALVKFFRGVAEGTLFTITNPEGSIHALWSAVPNSKPTGLSDSDAMAQAMAILHIRLPSITPDQGEMFGEMTPKMVNDYEGFLVGAGMIKQRVDPAAVLDPDIWKQADAFDRSPVIRQARSYK